MAETKKPGSMPKKLIRNVVVLVCFLIVLGAAVQLGKWLLNKRTDINNFDEAVIAQETGWKHLDRGSPDLAIEQFDRVLVQDAYNGYAMYGRAVAMRQLYYRLAKRKDSDPQELREAAIKAIAAFEKCLEFPRFRNKSLHSMSRISARQRDRKNAIAYIERAINDGYVSETGSFLTQNYDNFYYEFYRNDPKLRELQRQEAITYALRTNKVALPVIRGGNSKRRSKNDRPGKSKSQ